MPIELSPEQLSVLHETREAADPAEFQALLDHAKPEMDRIVREVMEPAQAISTTITELRDLYLSVDTHQAQLSAVTYGAPRRALLRDSIRLVATADLWLSEGARAGAYRVRSVEEVVQASRPWRARLKAYGAQAFIFEPEVADQFADVNSTGTLDEEKQDLRALNELVKQHADRLAAVGMKPAFQREGKALLDETSGRDLLGVLGLRNQEEAIFLRNRIVTYATLLGGEARAAGINGCFDDVDARRRFEAASFRSVLRRLRPRRQRGATRDEATTPDANGASAPGTGTPPS
jgi:hypothetical protein